MSLSTVRRAGTLMRGARSCGRHRHTVSCSTFWLTTCEEPPGAMVTP
jgi:hypothetical protein